MSDKRQLVKAYVPAGLKSELRDECERTGESESRLTELALRSYLAWRRQLVASGERHDA